LARLLRRLALIVFVVAVAGAVAWALWPRPVEVELARASVGTLTVTVDEDGVTRVKERYVVSSPLTGRLGRITLDPGDAIEAGQTLLAVIEPMDPALLDPRALALAEARVNAAQAALDQAEPNLARADAALEFAQSETGRVRESMERGGGSTARDLDEALLQERLRTEERRAAGFARDIAQFELEQAKAALLRTQPSQTQPPDNRFEIRAPISGVVLRVLQESAMVVAPGTPLIEVGNPRDLEIVVDVLSSDGVRIRPGAPVLIEQWGGDQPLSGRVRLVEPGAFLKISALGVEEQRVNAIVDFTDSPEAREGLGDGYRIEARITVWEGESILKIPTGALFRHAASWAVFQLVDGRARVRNVEVGRRNDAEAQVLRGLTVGDAVVVYPSDRVREGVRVRPRAAAE
jgi:HlyD family secretion protein